MLSFVHSIDAQHEERQSDATTTAALLPIMFGFLQYVGGEVVSTPEG